MTRKKYRPSLKDIADRVGVSTALVSYVLNGQEKEKRVGAEVANRIRQVAQELQYTPNQIARSLRKGSTKTIGLIVADIANPFFGTMARIIEDEANKSGYTVIIGSSDEDCNKSASLVDTLLNRQVDGFIIVPADGCETQISLLIQNEVPVVLLDRYFPGITTNSVVLDNHGACFDAVMHLVQKGYHHIGMISYASDLIHMTERVQGYMMAMRESGLGSNILHSKVRHTHLEPDMNDILRNLTFPERKVDALLFTTNTLTISGLYYIYKNCIKVPDELAVIGFDGNEAFDFFYAPLTYIEQPVEMMAKESVRLLLSQINGANEAEMLRFGYRLIKRQSCG